VAAIRGHLHDAKAVTGSLPLERSPVGKDRAVEAYGQRLPAGLRRYDGQDGATSLDRPATAVARRRQRDPIVNDRPVRRTDRNAGGLRLLDECPNGYCPAVRIS